jgi:hypothetical protein
LGCLLPFEEEEEEEEEEGEVVGEVVGEVGCSHWHISSYVWPTSLLVWARLGPVSGRRWFHPTRVLAVVLVLVVVVVLLVVVLVEVLVELESEESLSLRREGADRAWLKIFLKQRYRQSQNISISVNQL